MVISSVAWNLEETRDGDTGFIVVGTKKGGLLIFDFFNVFKNYKLNFKNMKKFKQNFPRLSNGNEHWPDGPGQLLQAARQFTTTLCGDGGGPRAAHSQPSHAPVFRAGR
jgi:hypothetical protein